MDASFTEQTVTTTHRNHNEYPQRSPSRIPQNGPAEAPLESNEGTGDLTDDAVLTTSYPYSHHPQYNSHPGNGRPASVSNGVAPVVSSSSSSAAPASSASSIAPSVPFQHPASSLLSLPLPPPIAGFVPPSTSFMPMLPPGHLFPPLLLLRPPASYFGPPPVSPSLSGVFLPNHLLSQQPPQRNAPGYQRIPQIPFVYLPQQQEHQQQAKQEQMDAPSFYSSSATDQLPVPSHPSTEAAVLSTSTTESSQLPAAEDAGSSDDITRRQQQIEVLRDLLVELKTPKFATYEKIFPKLMYDARFTSIPKHERRSAFISALRLLRGEKEKIDAKDKKFALESLQSFLKDLSSSGKIRSSYGVNDVVAKFSTNPRWPTDLDDATRDAIISEVIEQRRQAKEIRDVEDRATFIEMIEEYFDREHPPFPPRWPEIKRQFREDSRYVSVEPEDREGCYLDVMGRRMKEQQHFTVSGREHRREERREETLCPIDDLSGRPVNKRFLPSATEEEELRSNQKRKLFDQQATETLRQLMAERLKNPFTLFFKDALRILERDVRWVEIDKELSDERKREVYDRFVNDLKSQRLDLLEKELSLSETLSGPNVSFYEAAQLLGWETDRRFQGLPADKVEGRFLKWRRTALEEASQSFITFLRTTAMITADTPDHGMPFRKLMEQLSSDPRYSRLDGFDEHRDQLVINRIMELVKQRRETPRPILE